MGVLSGRRIWEGLAGPIGKTALASGLGWWLARLLVGTEAPYMAALAAILSLNVTVADSVSRGLQRTGGVLAGVALAFLLGRIGGPGAILVGVFVFMAMQLGRRAGLGPLGTPQVAISGLIVWSMGTQKEAAYAVARLLDTVIGAAAAVLVNAALNPPDFAERARDELRDLAGAAANVPSALQRAIEDGDGASARAALETARRLSARVDGVEATTRKARAALRWNPWAARRRDEIRRLLGALELLRRHVVQVRVLARTVVDIESKAPPEAPLRERLGALLQDTADVLAAFADSLAPGDRDGGPGGQRLTAIGEGVRGIWGAAQASSSAASPEALEGILSLTATIGRIAADERAYFRTGTVEDEG